MQKFHSLSLVVKQFMVGCFFGFVFITFALFWETLLDQ